MERKFSPEYQTIIVVRCHAFISICWAEIRLQDRGKMNIFSWRFEVLPGDFVVNASGSGNCNLRFSFYKPDGRRWNSPLWNAGAGPHGACFACPGAIKKSVFKSWGLLCRKLLDW
jgi:hypothetical protein